jgi:hypothetical protein
MISLKGSQSEYTSARYSHAVLGIVFEVSQIAKDDCASKKESWFRAISTNRRSIP